MTDCHRHTRNHRFLGNSFDVCFVDNSKGPIFGRIYFGFSKFPEILIQTHAVGRHFKTANKCQCSSPFLTEHNDGDICSSTVRIAISAARGSSY